jgi:hypothetical protein
MAGSSGGAALVTGGEGKRRRAAAARRINAQMGFRPRLWLGFSLGARKRGKWGITGCRRSLPHGGASAAV